MFKRILIPLDGSELSEKALPSAIEISNKFGAELILLRVVERPNNLLYSEGWVNVDLIVSIEEQARQAAAQYLQSKEAELAVQGHIVTTKLVEHQIPADAILNTVSEADVDLIIMSTHGHGGLTRWILGSVADKVMQKAEVPVLLVRVKKESQRDAIPVIDHQGDAAETLASA